MTEQEWLEQSDYEKNVWVAKNIDDCNSLCETCEYITCRSFLNWQGFGMIVKFEDFFLETFRDGYEVGVDGTHFAQAPTPWEAAALAYGKMKGLIK